MTAADYEEIRDNAIANLKTITSQPKPTYSVDGQRVEHADYVTRLTRLIDWANDQLAALRPVEIATTHGLA